MYLRQNGSRSVGEIANAKMGLRYYPFEGKQGLHVVEGVVFEGVILFAKLKVLALTQPLCHE